MMRRYGGRVTRFILLLFIIWAACDFGRCSSLSAGSACTYVARREAISDLTLLLFDEFPAGDDYAE